jgi:hypothetical protein
MSEMHNILNKLQQLNESTDVTEEEQVDEIMGALHEASLQDQFKTRGPGKDAASQSKGRYVGTTAVKNPMNVGRPAGHEEKYPGGWIPSHKWAKKFGEDTTEEHCGGSHKKKKTNESVEARLLKEYAEFKKSKLKEEPNEGNEFSGALAQAKKDGKEEFEVDGKKYKVTAEAKKPYVKPFDASGVRVSKRGKVDAVSRDYYHVKMEKDNVTKAERVLADDGESEMHIRMNAKRDNPGWKIVSVRKIDTTDDIQGKYSAQDRGRPRKIEIDEAAKPDYLDLDKDGDKEEPMKKAAKDKKEKKES